jgi:hypothetical protein
MATKIGQKVEAARGADSAAGVDFTRAELEEIVASLSADGSVTDSERKDLAAALDKSLLFRATWFADGDSKAYYEGIVADLGLDAFPKPSFTPGGLWTEPARGADRAAIAEVYRAIGVTSAKTHFGTSQFLRIPAGREIELLMLLKEKHGDLFDLVTLNRPGPIVLS